MKILIVGASGLVGSHCLHYFNEMKITAIGTHLNYKTENTFFFNPLDENCFNFCEEMDFKPEVIIHCGALTNVDYCEEHENESYMLTVRSTEVLVDFCNKNGIKLVYISTDYVFDGIDGPYKEDEEASPVNVYGKHKLEAEMLVRSLSEFLIVRITNVYGEEERSKNFVANLLHVIKSETNKTFNLPFDQFATPIYARDIAKMIYVLIIDNKVGIYNLASTDYYNRFQLAEKVKSYFTEVNFLVLNPISTKSLQQKAIRPLNGGLLNNKFSKEYPKFIYTNIDTFILKTIENGI